MPDLSDQIEENASGPKRMKVEGHEAEQHSLKEMIEADEYLKANEAAASPKRGFLQQRLKPPGSV